MGNDEAGNNGQREHSWDTVSNAVEMGYKVIQEQINQGKEFAGQFSGRAFSPDSDGGSGSGPGLNSASGADLLERIIHFYSDMGSLCFDMFESIARNPAFADVLRSTASMGSATDGSARASAAANSNGNPVQIEIVSATPSGARVAVEWLRTPGVGGLAVQELRALDPTCTALTDISYDAGEEGWQPVLRIGIPPDQPAGNYSGLIVDALSNDPCGTLVVRIPGMNGNGTG